MISAMTRLGWTVIQIKAVHFNFSAKKRDIFKDFGGTSLFGSTLSDMENTRRDFMSGMNKPQVQYKPTGYAQVAVDR